MPIQNIRSHVEDRELITNYDLVASAHALLEGIDLDVASSHVANSYVEAKEYFTPMEDGLNCQQWHGSVYLFPPSGTYFWDKKNQRWKMTRATSPTLRATRCRPRVPASASTASSTRAIRGRAYGSSHSAPSSRFSSQAKASSRRVASVRR